MSNDANTWQCSCNCWDRKEHADRLWFLMDSLLKRQPKWSVVSFDLAKGEIIESLTGLHCNRAWDLFDTTRNYYGSCNSKCTNERHECIDVTIAFDGRVEKSSVWS